MKKALTGCTDSNVGRAEPGAKWATNADQTQANKVGKNPRVRAMSILPATLGKAAQAGANTPTSEHQSASADPLSSGRCENASRCLCSIYNLSLHTTSFHCAYCTLLFACCQAFCEYSLVASGLQVCVGKPLV